MAFIPFPNCAEVVFEGFGNGHDAFITLGIRGATPLDSSAALNDLLDLMVEWWDDELSHAVCDNWTMPSIKATSLEDATAPSVQRFGIVPAAGLATNEPVQDNVAMVIKFATELRGRSYRGRNYVPFVPATDLANSSFWTSSAAALMAGHYGELPTILAIQSLEHVVLSRSHDLTPRTTGVATLVTSYAGVEKIGTMRRRVAGSGS